MWHTLYVGVMDLEHQRGKQEQKQEMLTSMPLLEHEVGCKGQMRAMIVKAYHVISIVILCCYAGLTAGV